MKLVSTIIPVYKNKDMTVRNLKHNYSYLKDTEIIMVDDGSDEDIKSSIEKLFPDVLVLVNDKNQGFGPTVNRGIQHSHGDYILLLNTDVLLFDKSFVQAASFLQKHEDYFAVSFMQKERNGDLVGKNKLYFEQGFINHTSVRDNKEGFTGWAEGGSALLRASYMKTLGGFSSLFAPFYYEDIDLSYRAKKMGWKVLFDPHIVVEHHHESTIGKYMSRQYVQTIAQRNHFLFMWNVLSDIDLWVKHIFYLVLTLVRQIAKGNLVYFEAFLQALSKVPQIIKVRLTRRYQKKDNEILNTV